MHSHCHLSLYLSTPQIKDDFLGRAMIHCGLHDNNPETQPNVVSVTVYVNVFLNSFRVREHVKWIFPRRDYFAILRTYIQYLLSMKVQ